MTFVSYWWQNSQICYWTSYNTIETWCGKFGLSVNPDKTGLVVFTRRKLPNFFEPQYFGVTLYCSIYISYLGVVLDSWLTWKKHMDVKVKKAHNLLCACRRVNGVTWGLRHKMIHWLYIFIIRPSITFASLVWWPGCQTASAKKRISRVQRLACLGIIGAMGTTATSAMDTLTCLPHWSY